MSTVEPCEDHGNVLCLLCRPDIVNHPAHYTRHASGIECIDVAERFGFCLGNAIKYIWRAELKGSRVEDLKKARWYLDREINRLEKET